MKECKIRVTANLAEALGLLVSHQFTRLAYQDYDWALDTLTDASTELEKKLRQEGLEPNKLIARGGFRSPENIDHIRTYGWDHERRNTYAAHMKGIHALPVEKMMFHGATEDPGDNPWFHVIKYNGKSPRALALYDTEQMTRYPEKFELFYQFKTTPKEALQALVHVTLLPATKRHSSRQQARLLTPEEEAEGDARLIYVGL